MIVIIKLSIGEKWKNFLSRCNTLCKESERVKKGESSKVAGKLCNVKGGGWLSKI